MGGALLSLLAGSLTTLSPCVLPILPIVLLGALDQHRHGPLALAGGMVFSFVTFGLLIYGAGLALGISTDTIRHLSAALLVMFGVVLLSGVLQRRLAAAASGMTGSMGGALQRFTPEGLTGQFALGALLGAMWSPCSGPTLGAAVTLAADSQTLGNAALIMLFLGLGACLPLLVLAYGSRQTLKNRRVQLTQLAHVAKPVLGLVLVIAGIFVLSGFDRTVEAAMTEAAPDWLIRLTTRF
ncbi:MAG: cytochrome c biogenesis protein CcdA [Betaproteobacteria bacterium]|nr:cytochrome c biogenesis protein CcdA [Betaproteobacteria bacterium]